MSKEIQGKLFNQDVFSIKDIETLVSVERVAEARRIDAAAKIVQTLKTNSEIIDLEVKEFPESLPVIKLREK